MKDKKLLIKKVQGYSDAIAEQVMMENVCKEKGISFETMICDTRDNDDLIEAVETFDVIIPDSGIYLLAKIDDPVKFARAIQEYDQEARKNFIQGNEEEVI